MLKCTFYQIDTMEVTVIFYGQLVEVMGSSSLKIIDAEDTDTVIEKLKLIQPLFKNLSFVVAANKKVIQKNTLLENDCEIVLLPPFAGG